MDPSHGSPWKDHLAEFLRADRISWINTPSFTALFAVWMIFFFIHPGYRPGHRAGLRALRHPVGCPYGDLHSPRRLVAAGAPRMRSWRRALSACLTASSTTAACGRLCITNGGAIRALVGLVLFYAFCAPVTWLQRLA